MSRALIQRISGLRLIEFPAVASTQKCDPSDRRMGCRRIPYIQKSRIGRREKRTWKGQRKGPVIDYYRIVSREFEGTMRIDGSSRVYTSQ